jgi:hypothetical protein
MSQTFIKKQEKINKRKSNPLLVIIGDNWEGISLASKADSESGEKEGEAHPMIPHSTTRIILQQLLLNHMYIYTQRCK